MRLNIDELDIPRTSESGLKTIGEIANPTRTKTDRELQPLGKHEIVALFAHKLKQI